MTESRSPDEGRSSSEDTGTDGTVRSLVEQIRASDFNEWYQERQFAQNIRQGKPYFNRPSPRHDPEYHTPSKLNQCHRKVYYDQLSAPEEDVDPRGLFWLGTQVEEDLVVEFLSDVVGPDEFVRNSIWFDFIVETDVGELQMIGETDPAVVGRDSCPYLVTEVKTVNDLEKPRPNHVAQVHAYMWGLSKKYDREVTNAILLYIHRKTFASKSIHVEFDDEFWHDTVLAWAMTQTKYRRDGSLPPANPELEGECAYCSFKHRCGRGDDKYSNEDADGLLPLFDRYPKAKVVEYLEAHSDRDAKLTPTLAHRYDDLAEMYDVLDWECQLCSATYEWNSVEWNGSTDDPPNCPVCSSGVGTPVPLSGPQPGEQLQSGGGDNE